MTKLGLLCACVVIALAMQVRVFDAVSIKANLSGQRGYALPPPIGGRLTAGNVSLKMLVAYAYHLQDMQLFGTTGWMNTETFDVEAKAPFAATEDQVRVMLQLVLGERFNLKFHTENRQMSAYTLRVSKKGLRMKRSTKDCEVGASSTVPCGGFRLYRRSQLSGQHVPISELAEMLAELTGRAVVDKTGLSAAFDIILQWTPDEGLALGPEAGAPPTGYSREGTLFTALDEQLGLHLQSEKQKIPVLIVDSADRPSRN